MGDMRYGYLAKSVNMFHMGVNLDNGKITKDWEEIEKLNFNEEGLLELGKQIGELANRIDIIDENMENRLEEQKQELGSRENC